jgi:hypothetical protein
MFPPLLTLVILSTAVLQAERRIWRVALLNCDKQDNRESTSQRMPLLQFRHDIELFDLRVVTNLKHVGLATNLAVLDVALGTPGRFVHGSVVPLTTTCALKACLHR